MIRRRHKYYVKINCPNYFPIKLRYHLFPFRYYRWKITNDLCSAFWISYAIITMIDVVCSWKRVLYFRNIFHVMEKWRLFVNDFSSIITRHLIILYRKKVLIVLINFRFRLNWINYCLDFQISCHVLCAFFYLLQKNKTMPNIYMKVLISSNNNYYIKCFVSYWWLILKIVQWYGKKQGMMYHIIICFLICVYTIWVIIMYYAFLCIIYYVTFLRTAAQTKIIFVTFELTKEGFQLTQNMH